MRRAVTYFAMSMFFGFIGHETHAHWVVWPILGMTVSFLIQAWHVFARGRDPRDAAAWRAERRMASRERRRMRRVERIEDFERKVQIGADALVRVIDEARNVRARHLDRDETRDRGRRVNVTPPPQETSARVRVDAREGESVEREGAADGRDGRGNRRA